MDYKEKLLDLYRIIEDEEMAIGLCASVSNNFAKVKRLPIEGLQLIKYNPATTMFKGVWDRYTVQGARGHIIADNDITKPVNMPFPKLFEAEELGIVIPPEFPVRAFSKRNGYMLDVTWSDEHNQLIVGTTGTIDSKHAQMGRSYIQDWMEEVFKDYAGMTFIFEVCDPSDPHIFPEPQGLYLIGVRHPEWSSTFNLLVNDYFIGDMASAFREFTEGVRFDPPYDSTYGEIEALSKTCDHEGFVVWLDIEGRAIPLKLKGQHYKIRKRVARANTLQKLAEILTGRNHDKLFTGPSLYAELRKRLIGEDEWHMGEFFNMTEQSRLAYMAKLAKDIREGK